MATERRARGYFPTKAFAMNDLQSIIDKPPATIGQCKLSIESFLSAIETRMFACRDETEMGYLRRMHKAASEVLEFACDKFPEDDEAAS
jgi:hypothetical protein